MHMADQKRSFLYKNSLSIVFVVLMLISLVGQYITGWHEHNEEQVKHGQPEIGIGSYLTTGHFVSATFENWESEFLQMALYVVLTVSLRQKGSSESKKIDEEEEVDREPQPGPDAPWAVRQGGMWLKLYSHSLGIVLFLLFAVSFFLHLSGSRADFNEEQAAEGKPLASIGEYIASSRFWFESFQNWQSEFLSVLSIVVLSIFLRQKGSPESKPVDASNDETGG
jgi:hypothetical protein